MFALRPLGSATARAVSRRGGVLRQEAEQLEQHVQKRHMSGGDDDGVHRV
jgi:hypothetical protein